jgi:hypothetical protein
MEDMIIAIRLPLEFPIEDYSRMTTLLVEAGICVPGYTPPPVGLYDPYAFTYEQDI